MTSAVNRSQKTSFPLKKSLFPGKTLSNSAKKVMLFVIFSGLLTAICYGIVASLLTVLFFGTFGYFALHYKPKQTGKPAIKVPLAENTPQQRPVFVTPIKPSINAPQSKNLDQNLLKAILQHKPKGSELTDEDYALLTGNRLDVPVKLSVQQATECGYKDRNEDAHFYKEQGYLSLSGIFDGHGGFATSSYAKSRFPELFFENYKQISNEEDFHAISEVFQKTVNQLHMEAIAEFLDGSTMCVNLINKKTWKMYTGNLADTETKIVRKRNRMLHTIPTSVVINWSSPKSAERAAKIKFPNDPIEQRKTFEEWTNSPTPKKIYFKNEKIALETNVSAAIGNKDWEGVLSQEVEMTESNLCEEDLVINACDGLWDVLPDDDYRLLNFIADARSKESLPSTMHPWLQNLIQKIRNQEVSLAYGITQAALHWGSKDNITVITIDVTK